MHGLMSTYLQFQLESRILKKMTVENTIVLIAGLGCAGGINYYIGNEIGILSKITNAVLVIIGGASIEKLRREWKLRFR